MVNSTILLHMYVLTKEKGELQWIIQMGITAQTFRQSFLSVVRKYKKW